MTQLQPYSYHLGVIDAFNEMIAGGLKAIALSHPCGTAAERDQLIPHTRKLCESYGNLYYVEDELLTTDLFPKSMTQNTHLILLYRCPETILSYLALKQEKEHLLATDQYHGENRTALAQNFGLFLGYPLEKVQQMMEKNKELE